MGFRKRTLLISFLITLLSLKSSDGDGVRLPDQAPLQNLQGQQNQQQQQQQQHQAILNAQQQQILAAQQQQQFNGNQAAFGEERRQGKGLLDLVGLGTGPNIDPYVARTNGNCLSGELSECFKTQALSTFDEFFGREFYQLTDNARVVRMPENQLRSLYQEPYEFSSESRSTDSEWDHLVKFGLRKLEKFVKSTALEVHIPEEETQGGRYSARFIDDIADEIDIIEDKKASLFTRHKLKKLFIPLLLVLKIFKLKLLLFLPFILGLASFKKLLGFAAIVIPGLIGYFKLCRPQQNFGGNYYTHGGFPQYSAQGLGAASYHPGQYQQQHHSAANPFFHHEPSFAKPYSDYYGKSTVNENAIRFGEQPQDLAYQGYSEYRNNNKDIS